MKPRQKRLLLIIAVLALVSVAALLVLNAFKSNLVFFYTPTEVVEGKVPVARAFRIGGMVVDGSLQRKQDGVSVSFSVTDTIHAIDVTYEGILPDLFQEGKGVVAQGRLIENGSFIADQVLAKHDENYMPPEAAEALKRARELKASE
ncbi:MAG: cytochrome c maturation protein CcmE [Betaproteobacteria bacterium]